MFFFLAAALGEACGTLDVDPDIWRQVKELPAMVSQVIEHESKPLRENRQHLIIGECTLWDIASQNVMANNFIFLGRGFNFPMALEGAMKCKEIAYIHAEGYPAAEMKHGPIALIDQFMPVVVIAPKADPTYDKIRSNIQEVKARSGSVIAITEASNTDFAPKEGEESEQYVIYVPETHEYLMPLVVAIPLQLLAYMMGLLRGNEVDNPRGLVKTVSCRAPSPTPDAME